MKRILHVITGLRCGGTEFKLLELCRATSRRWHHHVVTLGGQEGLYDDFIRSGIEVTALHLSPSLGAVSKLWSARALVRNTGPNVLFGWMYHGAFAAEMLGFGNDIPTAWSIHHSLHALETERAHTRALIRVLAYRSKLPRSIVYCSRSGRAQHEAAGFAPQRGLVIQTGHNVERFHFDPVVREQVRGELGIAADAFVVGIVGRFHETKGFRYFFEAVTEARRRIPHLVVLGIGPGLNLENVRASGWSGSDASDLRLLDEQQAIERYYPAFDLAVSSSIGEGLPGVIAEAMASQRVCVVTDVGDSAELLGGCGLVVPARSSSALASAMVTCAEMSHADREEMGVCARQRIEAEFNAQRYIERHNQLWEEVTCDA